MCPMMSDVRWQAIRNDAFYDGRMQLIYGGFHDGIEIIGEDAFNMCFLLSGVKLLGVKIIEMRAFQSCWDIRPIPLTLKCMIGINVFSDCSDLTTVELVGGIHNTVASLHLERWRNQMKDEINRINQDLKQ